MNGMGTGDIPTLDLARIEAGVGLDALDAACREWGVFQLVNHGGDPALAAMLLRQARRFFAQPKPFKRALERSAENPWGYFDRERTRHTPDWKEVFDFGPPDGDRIRPQWPEGMPAFKAAVEAHYAACDAVALRLLSAISVNLGSPPRLLHRCFRPVHTSFLRLNHYPECGTPASHRGVHRHTDAGALTLLLQDGREGLEVERDGTFHRVAVVTGALVVTLGDVLQVWSNDRYRAAPHQAIVHADGHRLSAPFFFNPAYGVNYAPLPATVDAANPPRYHPINWGEFRSRRAAGDYTGHGEYLEISHYHTAKR